jgi:hypothetical protein
MTGFNSSDDGQLPGAGTPPANDPGTKKAADAVPGAGNTPTGPLKPANHGNSALRQGAGLAKGVARFAFMAALAAPVVVPVGGWVLDGMPFSAGAGMKAVERSGNVLGFYRDTVVTVARAAAYPFVTIFNGSTGVLTGSAPQATTVKYCQPEQTNFNISAEAAQRRRDDQQFLRGAISEHLRLTQSPNPDTETSRIIKSGGFPVIFSYFSDPANPNSEAGFTVRNVPTANDQVCPGGYRGFNFNLQRG